jgi:DNA-binding NtrC family response regulator
MIADKARNVLRGSRRGPSASPRGDLDVQSTPKLGITVRIEPRRDEHYEPPRAAARILVVEDCPAVRATIAGLFEHEAGLEVVAQGASLAEARGMLHGVDIAILDLGLPDGNGGDLIGELHDVNPHAQVIIFSADVDPRETARAIASGAAVALNKITDLDKLVDVVRRLHRGVDR